MADSKVVMTPEAISYVAKVAEWVKTAPKAEDDQFWIGQVTVEWADAERPIATIQAEDEFFLVEVTNG